MKQSKTTQNNDLSRLFRAMNNGKTIVRLPDVGGTVAASDIERRITGYQPRKGVDPCISPPAAERKSEGSEPGYAQRFSLREGK